MYNFAKNVFICKLNIMSRTSDKLSLYGECVPLLEPRLESARSDWPAVRIQRSASILDHDDNFQWGDYLNILGNINHGKGIAKSLGSIAVTYVDAQELGQMLNAKYPKAYQDRSKTKQLVTRFQKDYNQFVKYKSLQLIENQTDRLIYEKIGADISIEDEDSDSRIWGIATVALSSQISECGKNKMGQSINEDFILREMQFTIEYLKDCNLNTEYIDSKREPHISIFKANVPVANAGLIVPEERLNTIVLDYPAAITT